MNLSATAEAEKMLFTSKKLLSEFKISEGLEMLNQLLEKFPEFGRAYAEIANVYFRDFNNESDGEKNFNLAIKFMPDFAPVYLDFAELLLQQERFTEVLAMLNKAMEIKNVKKDRAYFIFGTMYELQERLDDALKYYKKCIVITLQNELLEAAEKSINRCEIKKKYI
jgi:tetratricopeptide (TPR) repeat protein